MTVQEGGGSTAAPGVEDVPPASSTPRFVAIGEYVYDRELNRGAAFGDSQSARFALDQINAGRPHHGYIWEDAK